MIGLSRPTVAFGVVIAMTVGLADPALAGHEPARFGLTPVAEEGTYFDVTIEAGQTRNFQVEGANFGHEEAVARTYAANVYSIVNGGFGAGLFGERPTGTTTWVTFPTQELTLAPGDAVVMDVQVSVPSGTAPGEYIAALVIENAEPMRGSGTIAVDQINRSAIAVAIDVPGAREPALEITQIGYSEVAGSSVVTFGVDNPGNVHLQPAGQFILRDEAGAQISALSAEMDSVYAGTSTLLEVPVNELLAPGEYCGELTLSDEDSGATASTQCLPFTVLAPASSDAPLGGLPSVTQAVEAVGGPMIALPILLALLMLAAAGIVVWRRRRRHHELASGGVTVNAWPVADTGVSFSSSGDSLVVGIATLRRALREEPRIARAWIVERGSGFILAVEGAPGTTPAEASRLAADVQKRADRELSLVMPVQVVCLQGSGPVSRMTAEAAPFYVRRAET